MDVFLKQSLWKIITLEFIYEVCIYVEEKKLNCLEIEYIFCWDFLVKNKTKQNLLCPSLLNWNTDCISELCFQKFTVT